MYHTQVKTVTYIRTDDLVLELCRQTEDMCVVLREASHAEQAVQCARALVAVYSACQSVSERSVVS